MRPVYYNENNKRKAAWLRWLIAEGLLPHGQVDDRSIADVQPGDLAGFGQKHFFAGCGGWPLAFLIAGVPADLDLWSGSCPCQPFSSAGRREGSDDPRHLWPHLFRLIDACRPAGVVGEQVAGTLGYGWFDGVAADLGGADYACRAVDVPAAAVDSPQIRQRLWWFALDLADGAGRATQARRDGYMVTGHPGQTLTDQMSPGPRSTWPAPTAEQNDGDVGKKAQRRAALKEKHGSRSGNGLGLGLSEAMRLNAPAPWPAVQASAASAGHTSRSGDRKDELLLQGMMRENSPTAPWAAPIARDKAGPNSAEHTAKKKALGHGLAQLNDQMYQTSARPRAAPRAGDWRSGSSQVGASSLRPGGSMLPEQMTETQVPTSPAAAGGPAPTGSSATTTSRGGSPTPAHPCWLQGFPAVWLLGAAWATQSASRSPSKSSKPPSKRSSRRR